MNTLFFVAAFVADHIEIAANTDIRAKRAIASPASDAKKSKALNRGEGPRGRPRKTGDQ